MVTEQQSFITLFMTNQIHDGKHTPIQRSACIWAMHDGNKTPPSPQGSVSYAQWSYAQCLWEWRFTTHMYMIILF